jgi:hypothetical protein
MSLFKSYWTVQDISPDARDSAIRAANADGEELGIWLSRLIDKVSQAERDAVTLAENAAEQIVEDTVEDTVEDGVENTVEDTVDDTDDKLSSIERAMQQSRASGDVGSG